MCFRLIKCINKNKLVILYYHRITKPGEEVRNENKNMCTQYAVFEKQMEFLKENYHLVDEREIISAIEKKRSLSKYPVWITFDDGYKDNYINAYPVLKRLNIPATFYITTGFVSRPDAGSGNADSLFMSWDEIQDLKRNGFSIGAHTVTHRILSTINVDECEKEIEESKKEIEERTRDKVYSFAYPHGKEADIDIDKHPRILDKCGFKLAVTTLGGVNSGDLEHRRFALKRMGNSFEDNINIFKFKVATGCPWQK